MTTIRMKAWPACIAFAVASIASVGFAQSGDVPSPCASVTDDKSRLQCYDAENKMRATRTPAAPAPASAAPAAPAATPVPAPARAAAPAVTAQSAPAPVPTATSAREFGHGSLPAKVREAQSGAEPAEMTAVVTKVSGSRKGEHRIELDNGQLWMETSPTGGEPPDIGQQVTVRKAMMGSYLMNTGEGLALRVKRVR